MRLHKFQIHNFTGIGEASFEWDEFDKFRTIGAPISMKLSPAFKASLQKDLKIIEEDGKDVVAKALADYFRSQTK